MESASFVLNSVLATAAAILAVSSVLIEHHLSKLVAAVERNTTAITLNRGR